MLRRIFEQCLCILAAIIPKQPNLWVFGSWFGQVYTDNPRFVFEKVLTEPASGIKPIWITFSAQTYAAMRARNLPVATSTSWLGKWYMLRAGVAIFSTGYTTDFKASCIGKKTKKVQLWHGSGLKKIGSIPATSAEKPTEYDLMTVSANALKKRAHDEFGIKLNNIKITGMPRLDILAHQQNSLNLVTTEMETYRRQGKTVVLCAFTHRFDSKSSVLNTLLKQAAEFSPLLKTKNIVLFIKPHFYDTYLYGDDLLTETEINSPIKIISNHAIENNILSLFKSVDLLVTDFSSTYTDFLLTKKPIIFFDPERSVAKRTFYFDYQSHTPGPKVTTWKECLREINNFQLNPKRYALDRAKMQMFFHQFRDGKNTQRVLKEIKSLTGTILTCSLPLLAIQ